MKYNTLLIFLPSSLLLAVNSIPSPTNNRYNNPTQSPLYDEEQNTTSTTHDGLSLDQANRDNELSEAAAAQPPPSPPRSLPRALLNDLGMYRAATENEVRDGECRDARGREITNGEQMDVDDPNTVVSIEGKSNDNTVELKEIPSWMNDPPSLSINNNNNNCNYGHSIKDKIPTYVLCNQALLEDLVRLEVVLFGYAVGIGNWEYLQRRLMWLHRHRHLLIRLYGRGAFTSGLNWHKRVRPILEEIPSFREWFKLLERSFVIRHGWVLSYTVQGRHPFHADGNHNNKGQYRMILTLGANGKFMWFRKDENTDNMDDMVGALIDHGMTVFLTEEGGGGLGVEHGVFGDNNGSWFIGLELDLRDDEEFLERLRLFREGGNDDEKKDDEDGNDDEEKKGDEDGKDEEEEEDEGELQDAIALSLQEE